MSYLLIQNKNEAHIEAFTLLGASNTRGENCIGQFGSGTKHAINVLLRNNVSFFIYCGRTKLTFFTKEEELGQKGRERTHQRVFCKLSGDKNRVIDLGWVLDFGATDWTEVSMALREFVSNAIDETMISEGCFISSIKQEDLVVTPTDKCRARRGYTRVYIEATKEVQDFFFTLGKRFLHFSNNPKQVYQTLLPKEGRNFGDKQTPVIYREGVMVREVSEYNAPSIYDYNFSGSEVEIDECRNASEYAVKAWCSKALGNAKSSDLCPIIEAMTTRNSDIWEVQYLEPFYLWDYSGPTEGQKTEWQTAFEAVCGNSVLCQSGSEAAVYVQRKGFNVATIDSTELLNKLKDFELPTQHKVLDANEKEGIETIPANDVVKHTLDKIWDWVKLANLTNGKEKPKIECFRMLMDGEEDRMGFYRDGIVYVREDMTDKDSKFLSKVVLDELTHHVTGSGDSTRDFQDFLLRLIVEICD